MKKKLLLTLLLCLLTTAALADRPSQMSQLADRAVSEFQDWYMMHDTWYFAREDHYEADMMRMDGDLLRLRVVTTVFELNAGLPEHSAWDVIDYAPIPLTTEAARRAASGEIVPLAYGYIGNCIAKELLPYAAADLLAAGEHWTELISHENHLVGVAETDDEPRTCRMIIAHWDGERFDSVEATPPQTMGIDVNEIHSGDGSLEVDTDSDSYSIFYVDKVNGQWLLSGKNSGEGVFLFDDGCIRDVGYGWEENNDTYLYGDLRISSALTELDFSAFDQPLNELLDASAFACTAHDDTPMYDAANGMQQASLYTRVAGRIMAEEDGWVQLHIGERGMGFDGWFRREDLAFGDAVNHMLCNFPYMGDQHHHALFDRVAQMLNFDRDDWYGRIWIIGSDMDGNWLLLTDNMYLVSLAPEAGWELEYGYHYIEECDDPFESFAESWVIWMDAEQWAIWAEDSED